MAAQAGANKPPDPSCSMCGSPLAKSPAGLHVLSQVEQQMKKKGTAPAAPRSGPGMSAPVQRGPQGPHVGGGRF